MDNTPYIVELLRKYLHEALTAEEAAELQAWASATPENRQLLDRIGTEDRLLGDMQAYWDLWNDAEAPGRERRIREGVQLESDPSADASLKTLPQRGIKINWRVPTWRDALPYAAALAILLTVGWLVWGDRWVGNGKEIAATEILPGGNRATLTLADGRVINLDEAQTGIIVGTENITYDDGSPLGAVIPSAAEESLPNPGGASVMLSLTTPKGGTYQITLPDGSKVWLNAASTLKYPSRFSGYERIVELTGEAFFEISSAPMSPAGGGRGRLPFTVKTDKQSVDVLGTQFNISAYPDDDETKTTLVEGKVRVDGAVDVEAHNHAPNKSSVVLTPGQQATTRARLPGQGAAIQIHEVDVTQFTNWRNGRFSFDDKPFADIMKELGRWYDLEVTYEGPVPTNRYFGGAYRTQRISLVLDVLRAGGIDYRITKNADGKHQLTVINKAGGHR